MNDKKGGWEGKGMEKRGEEENRGCKGGEDGGEGDRKECRTSEERGK